MKTIQTLALTCIILLLLSCNNDDAKGAVAPDSEETGEFLEQDLHMLYLRQQIERTNEKIKELDSNDPDNQGQLEELKAENERNEKYLEFLKEQTESIFEEYPEFIAKLGRIGPIPPAPSPCNCLTPINLTKVVQIIRSGEVEGFSATIFSENQDILLEFSAPEAYENSKLNFISLEGIIDYEGKVTLRVSKLFEPIQEIISYAIEGGINL